MLESILLRYAKLATLPSGEDGQALIEYAMILGLVSILSVAALSLIGTGVGNLIAPVSAAL